jgi:hypothetical protein
MKLGFFLVNDARFRRVCAFGGLGVASLLFLSACGGDEPPPDRTAMLPPDERVSSVPWNKPQGWENQGSLGALANDPRFGGQTNP